MTTRRHDAISSKRRGNATKSRTLTNKSRAYLDAILESTVEGVVVIDNRGVIETFNRAAQQMFGYSVNEIVGENVSILMPEPYRGMHDRYISTYLQTGRAKIIGIGREVVGLRKDGSTFPMELAVSEVRMGARRTFAGLVKDITERKTLEKEILEVSEREQRRIGRELHDGVCQELAGIAFQVQTMQRKLFSRGTLDTSEVAQVVDLLQNAMRHARQLSHGLYPVDASPNGLTLALKQLAATTTDLLSVPCTFHCKEPVELTDSAAATNLYRIAQEAVRDAVHRGHPRQIAIMLSQNLHEITLSVVDDGVEFEADGQLRTDMVLQLMQHRASVMGARLHVGPGSQGGVCVECKCPRSMNKD